MEEKIEVDIRVPNQTRYLSLIGKIGLQNYLQSQMDE